MRRPSTQTARRLRRPMTFHDERLWTLLRNRAFQGLKFKRQQPIDHYIADFCCLEKRLIVELDGAVHGAKDQKIYDQNRDQYLTEQGFKVLRISNSEIEKNLPKVLAKID